MATEKQKLKRMTALTAIISLVSFIYKCGLGIYSMSLVLIIASLSTLMVFICKVAFVKTVNKSRAAKKKSYLWWLVNRAYTVEYVKMVPAKCFSPAPKVKSCLTTKRFRSDSKASWDIITSFTIPFPQRFFVVIHT